MKKHNIFYSALITLVVAGACKQDVVDLKQAPVTTVTPSKGSADFTKFVAIGTSYSAGFQAAALFNEGQANSLPAILANQFAVAGVDGGAFHQPDINSELGYNIFISPNPGANNLVLGRLLLQGANPVPTPQAYALGDLTAVPNPTVNPGFLFAGSKADLNNFSVEAITLGQFLIPNTGNWGDPNPAHGFSPFYARFASSPGTSTIIGDAAAAQGTFFMFWGGMDDFMLYAAFGGNAKLAPLTDAATFTAYYGAAINTLLTSNANLKGVVANFPDIFVMPHFTSVSYNPIPLDAPTAAAVSEGFAGYNAALAGLVANAAAFGINSTLIAEINTRTVSFAAGTSNKPLIYDTDLTDLGPYFDGLKNVGAITPEQRTALTPYQRVRQTTASDILPLAAGSVLGTLVNNDPTLVNGVSVPLADQYVIVPSERDSINNARIAFNAAISTVAASSDKLALADVATDMATLVTYQAGVYNNVTITPNINPPTGIYSEDGLHPNSRGYAFISLSFIQAINTKFGAAVPKTNIGVYHATALPIP